MLGGRRNVVWSHNTYLTRPRSSHISHFLWPNFEIHFVDSSRPNSKQNSVIMLLQADSLLFLQHSLLILQRSTANRFWTR